MDRKRIIFDDAEAGQEWVAAYHLGMSDYDDDMSSNDIAEISFNAADFDTAVKYAQQYLRKMQIEEETADKWTSAEIMSVEMR